MIELSIDKKIIDFFLKEKISIDKIGTSLLILKALYEEEHEFLDSIDENNKNFSTLLMYAYLERKGFIYYTNDSEDVMYRLTEKGNKVTDFLPIQQKNETKKEIVDTSTDINILEEKEEEKVITWIDKWIQLFPEGKIYGRYLRDNKVQCADRMDWFIKTYGFDKNTIMQATRNYLDSQESSSSGHTYTRNSSYFIYKGRSKAERTSDLATWCERIETEGQKEMLNYNRDVM